MNPQDRILFDELYNYFLPDEQDIPKNKFFTYFNDLFIETLYNDKKLPITKKADMMAMISRYYYNRQDNERAEIFKQAYQVFQKMQKEEEMFQQDQKERKRTADILYTLNVKGQKPRPGTLEKYNIIYDENLSMYRRKNTNQSENEN